jgi:hypothetical protein
MLNPKVRKFALRFGKRKPVAMIPSRSLVTVALLAFAGVVGCGAGGPDDLGSNSADETEQGQNLGPINPNETKSFNGDGAHSYAFDGSPGDTITATVSNAGGAVKAWITDPNFTVIDTADGNGKVTMTVPSNAGGYKSFRVVFKEPNGGNGSFKVKLGVAAGACNPPTESWHSYVGTPDQCITLHFNCTSPDRPFANSCGCGCEHPSS